MSQKAEGLQLAGPTLLYRRHMIWIYSIFELISADSSHSADVQCYDSSSYKRRDTSISRCTQTVGDNCVYAWGERGSVCECGAECAFIHTVNLLLNETLESETLYQTLRSLLKGSMKMKVGAGLKLRFDNRPICHSLKVPFMWLPCITGHYLPFQLVMTVNIKRQRGWWRCGIHESIHRNALPSLQCHI